jgi:serine/threonine protein kinase
LFFYGSWDWRFLFLLSFSTFLGYFSGIRIENATNVSWRKFWFWLSIVLNVGFLGLFKYYNFFVESFASLFSKMGMHLDPSSITLNIILPVGISFYTFHVLSYVIDIYLNRIKSERNLVDFGLSKDFIDENGNHIEHTKNKSYVGTIRYMSVNCHKGTETSRRDDMASFIYMLFFFYFGQLPWQGLNDPDKKKRLKAIQALKSQFNKDPQSFYEKKIPGCLVRILDYVRKLKFKQAVDYDRIRRFLYEGMFENGYDYDYKWDWIHAV